MVLSTLNLFILDAGILIKVQQVKIDDYLLHASNLWYLVSGIYFVLIKTSNPRKRRNIHSNKGTGYKISFDNNNKCLISV